MKSASFKLEKVEEPYKKDNQGQEVITKLNEEVGQEIANAGKGVYINIDNSIHAEQKIKAEISNLKKATYSTSSFTESNEQFVLLALIVLLIIVIEACITEKKNSLFHFFNNKK